MAERKRFEISPWISAAIALTLTAGLMMACSAPHTAPPAPTDYDRRLAPGERALERVRNPADYPDFAAGYHDLAALEKAVDGSLSFLAKPSSRQAYPLDGITHSRVRRSLEVFRDDLQRSRSGRELAERVRKHFVVYRSVGCDGLGTVRFTGYCEPVLRASLHETDRFRYPLYRLPSDLVKDPDGTIRGRRTAAGVELPYYTREEIDTDGILQGRGLELVWLDHLLDVYVIHVQGSASLLLPDGSIFKVGYAGKNGRPYSSLGQALVAAGRLDAHDASLDRIRAYLDDHPGELSTFLNKNQSYIFFTRTEGGPFGSIGVQVTPYCSIATDKAIFPRAALTFIETDLPAGTGQGRVTSKSYRGFALDQDAGGAILSAGRVDVFMGTGAEAELLAGRTRSDGSLYYLFVKDTALD